MTNDHLIHVSGRYTCGLQGTLHHVVNVPRVIHVAGTLATRAAGWQHVHSRTAADVKMEQDVGVVGVRAMHGDRQVTQCIAALPRSFLSS